MSKIVLDENDVKLNAFYIYTMVKNNYIINNNNNVFNIKFDKETLQNLIKIETNSQRINLFEQILWNLFYNNNYNNNNNIYDMVKVIINYYFNNNNNNNNNSIEKIILKDFHNLCKRYKNYRKILFYEYESMIYRKFLLNIVLFMEKVIKYKDEEILLSLIMIIKLWHLIDIDKEILETKFIPIAFSKWYKDYSFYKYYFCIFNNDMKNDLYKTFLKSIINNKNEIINNVNFDIEKVLKKNTFILFFSY